MHDYLNLNHCDHTSHRVTFFLLILIPLFFQDRPNFTWTGNTFLHDVFSKMFGYLLIVDNPKQIFWSSSCWIFYYSGRLAKRIFLFHSSWKLELRRPWFYCVNWRTPVGNNISQLFTAVLHTGIGQPIRRTHLYYFFSNTYGLR